MHTHTKRRQSLRCISECQALAPSRSQPGLRKTYNCTAFKHYFHMNEPFQTVLPSIQETIWVPATPPHISAQTQHPCSVHMELHKRFKELPLERGWYDHVTPPSYRTSQHCPWFYNEIYKQQYGPWYWITHRQAWYIGRWTKRNGHQYAQFCLTKS